MDKQKLFEINHAKSISIVKNILTGIIITIVFLLIMIIAGGTYPY